jgi:hypothetical protein
MPETQGQYIATPTYGSLFQDTYLKTHRQRMETSIQMAQQELSTEMELLKYYQEKEKQYLDYIEEVGTSTGTGKTTEKQFDKQLAIAKLRRQVANDKDKQEMANRKYIDNAFTPDDTASMQKVAREAALNLPLDFSKIKTSISGINTTPGTTQALATAVQLYSRMQSEAAASGNSQRFIAHAPKIRQAIAEYTGTQGMGAEAMMQTPKLLTDMKEQERQRLAASSLDSLSARDLKGLSVAAGITPAQSSGQEVSEIAKQQEQLMADRLITVQSRMGDLEDKIQQKSSAEDIMNRSREIYKNEFANSPERKQVKKLQKQNKRTLADMNPDNRYVLDAYAAARTKNLDPYFFVKNDDNAQSVDAKANELMNVMINNKGSGNPLNVIQLSNQMGKDNKESQVILGAAIKGLLTHIKETQPQQETAKAQKVEQQTIAAEEVVDELTSDIEVGQTRVLDAQKEATAAESAGLQAQQPQVVPFDAVPLYRDSPENETDAMFAARMGMPPVELKPLDVGTVVKKEPGFSYGYSVKSFGADGTPQFQFFNNGALSNKVLSEDMKKEAAAAYKAQQGAQ